MATYVNDLRLKEIATGDESGTWGTSTNTNLELIGNAMGVGAEAIANASTHTITMADGVADEFRSTFLRLTGGGQACTVTLAPNTLSHTWIMRNETSATLTLTQGSGANVAIAAGQTKIVATDGAGSGAVVYEMDDLELAGNLVIGGDLTIGDDLTITDDLNVGDDINLTSDSSLIKFGADGDTTLTHTDGTGLTLNSTNKLTFGDTASFVQQSGDGVLRVDGEATIDLNASTAVTVSNDLKLDSDAAVLGFGADNDTTLTHTDGSGLTLNSTNKIMFNDASQFIQGSSATVLSLGATDEIDLTATAIDVNGTMDVSGAFTGTTATFTTADNLAALTVISTDADANVGPLINFQRDSGSPADSDTLGRLQFLGKNDASEDVTYASIDTIIQDASDGTEDAQVRFRSITAGTTANRLEFTGAETVFNESSKDLDFRVESDGNTHMLFVDAGNSRVGIGTSSPVADLSVGSVGSGTASATPVEVNLGSTFANSAGSLSKAKLKLFEDSSSNVYGLSVSSGLLEFGVPSSAGHAFFINESEAMRIDSSGNVGIGTSNATPSNGEGMCLGSGSAITRLDIRNSTTGDATGDGTSLQLNGNNFTIENREAGYVAFATSLTERMRINAAGYVNPNANVALTNAPDTQGLHFGWNYSNGAGESLIVFNRGAGTTGGLTFVDNSSSGTHDEVMRLESGNLGIGTSSLTEKLEVDGSINAINQSANFATGAYRVFADIVNSTKIARIGTASGANTPSGTQGELTFYVNNSEYMRIDSSGRLLHGVTSGNAFFHEENPSNQTGHQITTINGYTKPHIQVASVSAASTSFFHFVGQTGNGSSVTSNAIIIYGNGNIQNVNNSYGALSDVKLKENIVDSGSQWEDIKAVRVRKYSMIADKESAPNRIGVIAQELESAGMGGLVLDIADRDEDFEELETSTKSVHYSVLYMKAIKALQEAMTRIETLEAKVQTLESN